MTNSTRAWEADPILEPATDPFPGAPLPIIQLGPGWPVPALLRPSQNPNSAGLYPLGRKYSIADEAIYRLMGLYTGTERDTYALRVSSITRWPDRIFINVENIIWDSMGNWLRWDYQESETPKQLVPAELQVGRKWTATYHAKRGGQSLPRSSIDYRIFARERVTVPAGTFHAFRIEGRGWAEGNYLEETQWVLPWVNFPIRLDRMMRAGNAPGLLMADRHELLSLTQYAIDNSCVGLTDAPTRSLVGDSCAAG